MTFLLVTVIVPAKNEEQYIVKCINSLYGQDYDQQLMEIIVVDNGSTDDTVMLAREAGAIVKSCPVGRIGRVRNHGANAARGDILAFIDADCEAPKWWLSSLVGLLSGKRVGAVGGYFHAPVDGNWLETCWALRKNETEKNVKILATGSFALTRQVFEIVGGFNEIVVAGEDTDISSKIIDRGYLLILSPTMSVIHNGFPKTISAFIKRQVWQTSNYLQTRKYGFDGIFILSNIFLICLLFSVIAIFMANILMLLSFLLGAMSLAFFLGAYRFSCSVEAYSVAKLARVIILNCCYLLGRAIGLLKSYFSLLQGGAK